MITRGVGTGPCGRDCRLLLRMPVAVQIFRSLPRAEQQLACSVIGFLTGEEVAAVDRSIDTVAHQRLCEGLKRLRARTGITGDWMWWSCARSPSRSAGPPWRWWLSSMLSTRCWPRSVTTLRDPGSSSLLPLFRVPANPDKEDRPVNDQQHSPWWTALTLLYGMVCLPTGYLTERLRSPTRSGRARKQWL